MKKYVMLLVLASSGLFFSCKKQNPELTASIERGKAIYSDFCVVCHMDTGLGIENAFPPLAQSDYLLNNREKSIHMVKYGGNGEIIVNGKKYIGAMTNLNLTNKEVSDVMNYILNSWGNESRDMVTEEEVAKVEK